MASAEGITFAVERAIHDALRESIQRIADQHGIRVTSLSAEWVDVCSTSEQKFLIQTLRAETVSVSSTPRRETVEEQFRRRFA